MKNTKEETIRYLKETVNAIALPRGRTIGSDGHTQVEQYLSNAMDRINLLPYKGSSHRLPYRSSGQNFLNIVGTAPGRNRNLSPILIGAHYDSPVDAPCADDNAAAVAIALEIGKRFRKDPIGRDVVVALFDAEEPPHFHNPDSMGSMRFFNDERDSRGFHAALIMDLVGHDVPHEMLKECIFMTGAESHSEFPAVLGNTTVPSGLKLVPALNRHVGDMSDHHIFRISHVPFLFFSCGRWEHYHSSTDTVDRLNFEKMERICDLLENIVRTINNIPTLSYENDSDTVQFETKKIREALGPMLRMLGMPEPKTRGELDRLATVIKSAGL